jgi:hypothetical protein
MRLLRTLGKVSGTAGLGMGTSQESRIAYRYATEVLLLRLREEEDLLEDCTEASDNWRLGPDQSTIMGYHSQ